MTILHRTGSASRTSWRNDHGEPELPCVQMEILVTVTVTGSNDARNRAASCAPTTPGDAEVPDMVRAYATELVEPLSDSPQQLIKISAAIGGDEDCALAKRPDL